MTFEEEQKQLFLNYLEGHVFYSWRDLPEGSFKYPIHLELIVSPVCNTKCTYCYYKNFGDELYPAEVAHKQDILDNCEKVLKWVQKENFDLDEIEIFSGEFLNLPYYKDILEMISKYTPKGLEKKRHIVIPTNGTFCMSDEKMQEIQEILDKYNNSESSISIHLSLSCDGKYLDNETRALRNGKQYDDAFYERLFKFAYKNNFGFHPMIGPKGIDKWKENIDWYAENVSKYCNVSELKALSRIYLLEVRNPDWTIDEIESFKDFIKYYTEKVFNLCGRDPEKFYDYMVRSGSNIYRSVTSMTNRGMHCSIQSVFAVRLGDLALVPCHRTSYKGFNAGYLKFDEDSNMDIDLENPLYWMAINSFDSPTGPKCADCPINRLCGLYCGGCNYEVNGDFFTPVDTVCDMEIGKTTALVQALIDTDTFDITCDRMGGSPKIKEQIRELKKIRKVLINLKESEK